MTDCNTHRSTLEPAEIEELGAQLSGALATSDMTHGLARALRSALKELKLYRNHIMGREMIGGGTTLKTPPRVQIGGGTHRLEGFLNIDIVPPADLVWDVREGIPLAAASVEFLFSEHFLEHIDYPRSVKFFLAEAQRVLRDGGRIVTGVPDAEVALRAYTDRDAAMLMEMRERWYGRRHCLAHFQTHIDLVNYVFRDQDDDDRYTPHLWAYDYEKLADLLSEAGFRQIERWPFDPMIANPERRWSSLYVVATR